MWPSVMALKPSVMAAYQSGIDCRHMCVLLEPLRRRHSRSFATPSKGELIVNMCKRSLQGLDRRVWETSMEVLVWLQMHSEEDPSPGHVSQHLLRKTDPDGKASRATSNGVCFVSTSTDEIYCASLTNVHQREMASMCRAKDKIGWVVIGDGTTCK